LDEGRGSWTSLSFKRYSGKRGQISQSREEKDGGYFYLARKGRKGGGRIGKKITLRSLLSCYPPRERNKAIPSSENNFLLLIYQERIFHQWRWERGGDVYPLAFNS